MDENPPVAAGPTPRPSALPPSPAAPGRVVTALRHLGLALAGLGLAALTGAACALSFETLRALALTGGARADLAYLYPAGFDALLVITLISVLLLRGARWPVRLQAGAVLVLLLLAVATAEVARAAQTTPDVRQAAIAVAVAPWVMLTAALWLWLLLTRHAHVRRAALDARYAEPDGRQHDIVPFPEGRSEPPAAESAEPHPGPARPAPVEAALDPRAAPPLEAVPAEAASADLSTEPVVGPTPAPETPSVDEMPAPPAADGEHVDGPQGSGEAGKDSARTPVPITAQAVPAAPSAQAVPEPSAEPSAVVLEPPAGPATAPEPAAPALPDAPAQDRPTDQQVQGRPVRWGDLTRPYPGDQLVHPPRRASREPLGRDGRDEADTQPMSAPGARATERAHAPGAGSDPASPPDAGLGPDPDPDPAHGSEAADPRETDAAAPPSGRMRSTPLPPEG
ncbi:DUF2637 domain-containing protein [Planomonospora corallina]|uniref:DUF2637 domain-containing protein n=1 Tax=Planomonospora corallina TaxID=1806052 RepID=A0ABV8IIL4_9ACTN